MSSKRSQVAETLRNLLSNTGEGIGRVDDAVQLKIRQMLGEQDGEWPVGSYPELAKAAYGMAMHSDRHMLQKAVDAGLSSPWNKPAYLLGTRAAQAGGLTAAGVGIVNLTHALQNQFGGPADGPAPDDLMNYQS